MVFKNFRFNCILRVVLLVGTITFTVLLASKTAYFVTACFVGGIAVLQVIELIWFVEKLNREVADFLNAIQYNDFSITFAEHGTSRSVDRLHQAFNMVMKAFLKARSEKEEQYRFVQVIIEHIGVGLIAYYSDGKVALINRSAKSLLKINFLKHLDDLEEGQQELQKALAVITPKETKTVKLISKDELTLLSVQASELKMAGRRLMLVSLQDIRRELDNKEIESWHNLIRVLTHEIMNSLTPITSLANTALGMVEEVKQEDASDLETVEDLHQALATISKRSQGLQNFVKAYRNITKLPQPNLSTVKVEELLSGALHLIKPRVESSGIELQWEVNPPSLRLIADIELIEQVIINLLINAIDAVEGQEYPKITLSANLDDLSRVVIKVSDNGCGIDASLVDKVFIPFFTTKREGTGVGLSLSKQIMHMHQGNVYVQSTSEAGTVISLRFGTLA